jgi:DNA-binding transcriptional MerR regulator
MEWSIQELARAAATTSRTLRHYGAIGLLPPSRVGANGYRYYDEAALVRLQRIRLLRELGLRLSAIADVLAGEQDAAAALRVHLQLLEDEQCRIGRQAEAVRTTLTKLERGEELMPSEMFAGFDHAEHRDEVIERWGRGAWERGDRWWRSLSEDGKRAHRDAHAELACDWARAAAAGEPADGDTAQALAERHVAWLSATTSVSREYLLGLADLYVADPRFRANYDEHAPGTAESIRAALRVYADRL